MLTPHSLDSEFHNAVEIQCGDRNGYSLVADQDRRELCGETTKLACWMSGGH